MKSSALSVGLVAYIVVKVYSLRQPGLQPPPHPVSDIAELAEAA